MNQLAWRRPLTVLIAVATIVLATLGLLGPANAAPSSLPAPAKTANLHITKEATPAKAPGDGTQQDPGNAPIQGVTFTIRQVDATSIDLTTNGGWAKANDLSTTYDAQAPTSVPDAESIVTGAGYSLGAAKTTEPTDANGKADFTGLPLGLYLVEETSVPAGVSPSVPFLVTLPLTDPSNTSSWLYDVYVYPKNAQTTVTKSVEDSSQLKLGDPVTWTIDGDIPASTGPNDKVTGYLMTDNLDSKLTYDSSKPATAALSNGTELTARTDYTVTYDAAKNAVDVKLTDAGLAILGNNRSAKVEVTIPTTVSAVGEITNTAELYPNQGAVDSHDNADCPDCAPGTTGGPTGGTPSNPVESKWGSFTVQKTDPNGKALTGASFKVYPTLDDAKAGTNAIAIEETDTWTTAGTDGTVTIDGLRYSDFANGKTVAEGDAGWQDYYLVETQAPTGYELLAQPIKFDVTADTSTAGVDLAVKDVPRDGGFKLPFTGGVGSSLVYLAGTLLVLGALTLAVGRRRTKA